MYKPIMSHPKYAVVYQDGSLLCRGNPNEGLSYHLNFIDLHTEDIALFDLKKDAQKCLSDLKRQMRARAKARGQTFKCGKYEVKRIQMFWATMFDVREGIEP